MNAADFRKELESGALLLDIRNTSNSTAGRIKGSLNIGLSGQFASWAGSLIEFGTPILLIGEDLLSINEAIRRLARVGIESVVAYLKNGISEWIKEGYEVETHSSIGVDELKNVMANESALLLLDVRRKREYDAGHIQTAINIPLDQLGKHLHEIPRDSKLAVICTGGYRSTIAKSLLERNGFADVMNVRGGMASWQNSSCELSKKDESTVCSIT
ncbi:MAG: hypothetical protein K2X27_26265 [Candidatus Obscuribacterales bacterium]|nr:hypothetical protein [Candidatus Obscuribacterales bacterium]